MSYPPIESTAIQWLRIRLRRLVLAIFLDFAAGSSQRLI
jgi:hypothetical protein